jgi:ABC-type nitrate/sulfonate/bicarbonate transport system substrate-binding protein
MKNKNILHSRKSLLSIVTAVLLVVTLISSLSACGKAEEQTDGVVYFNYPEWVYYDLVYLADELGYFENANIKPNYVGQIAAGQMIPALSTGSLDLVNRHTPLVISAIEAGADIQIIAAGSKSTQANPHMKYFVKADSPINGIADFEGKTLGINSFGACSEFVTKKALRDIGLNPDSVKMITAPDSEQEAPLLRGDTDIAIIHPLSSGRATANTIDFRLLLSDWDIDGGISGLCPYTASGEFVREHPEEVKELIGILSKAAKWNNENPDEARQMIADKFGFKLEEAEMFEFYEDQIIPAENMQYWYDMFTDLGLVTTDKVKVEDIYTNEYNPAK